MPSVLHRQAEAGGHRWACRALRASLRAPRQEVLSRQFAEADRLGALRSAKLRSLVRSHWGTEAVDRAVPGPLPGGATLVEGGTSRAWVLIDDRDPTSFGPALVWADRRRLTELHVIVDDGAVEGGGRAPPSGVVARRAAEWSASPTVWRVREGGLATALPARPPEDRPLPAAARPIVDLLARHGTEPVVEHGVLTGELLGLEVARASAGPDGWRLEVGVGRLDRDARNEMRPGEADGAAVDDVVRVVRTWRRAGAPRHPANTLARERWLRAALVARPDLVGAAVLAPLAPPLPRRGIRTSSAAPALGEAPGGEPLMVVVSTGVDVDLVPTAADARRIHLDGTDRSCRLVIVVPEGDDYPVTRTLAAGLRHPAEVRTVPRDWPSLTG